jgi:Nucleotidyltransferase of unknown function (DUF6036)
MADISDNLGQVLTALAEQLEAEQAYLELVVCGGAALLALGFVDRATRDVDVLALWEAGSPAEAEPLPEPLLRARRRVARDFDLQENWLNPGPTDLLKWGLPEGFADRLEMRRYGRGLTVHFIGRIDQIHLKLYAVADLGGGRHEADLRALKPTAEELLQAARWTRTQDPSGGFRESLIRTLRHLGLADANIDI